MSEKPSFNLEAEMNKEIKIDLKLPKTAEKWCELYRVLSGKDVYYYLNWGNETEASKLLTYEKFKAKAQGSRIDLHDLPLISAVDKMIEKS